MEELLKGGWEELAAAGQEGGSSLYRIGVLVVKLLPGGQKRRLLGTIFFMLLQVLCDSYLSFKYFPRI